MATFSNYIKNNTVYIKTQTTNQQNVIQLISKPNKQIYTINYKVNLNYINKNTAYIYINQYNYLS